MNDSSFRLHEYLRALEGDEEPLLRKIRLYAREHYLPIISLETKSFLETVIELRAPESILEIGACIGYSTVVLALAAPGAKITTVESYERRLPLLTENLEKASALERTKIIESDAFSLLKELVSKNKKYDFIFLDAAKGQYLKWLPYILELMDTGSVLFADNVLQDETIKESRFLLPHRARSTHVRMREFLYRLKHDDELISSVTPVGDGVSVSVKL